MTLRHVPAIDVTRELAEALPVWMRVMSAEPVSSEIGGFFGRAIETLEGAMADLGDGAPAGGPPLDAWKKAMEVAPLVRMVFLDRMLGASPEDTDYWMAHCDRVRRLEKSWRLYVRMITDLPAPEPLLYTHANEEDCVSVSFGDGRGLVIRRNGDDLEASLHNEDRSLEVSIPRTGPILSGDQVSFGEPS